MSQNCLGLEATLAAKFLGLDPKSESADKIFWELLGSLSDLEKKILISAIALFLTGRSINQNYFTNLLSSITPEICFRSMFGKIVASYQNEQDGFKSLAGRGRYNNAFIKFISRFSDRELIGLIARVNRLL